MSGNFPYMKIIASFALLLASVSHPAAAQNEPPPQMCLTSELMKASSDHNEEIRRELLDAETFTGQFIAQSGWQTAKTVAVDTYRIPVVFHVYGSTQGGKAVSDTLIQNAIKALNADFNGLNADYNMVNNQFLSLRSTLNIRFMLAKKDPKGRPTTGIEYSPVKSGYATYGTYDAQIAADAWDNYRYVNVYVMNDLYGNGVTTNSGIATYPSNADNNSKVSRIVYNGAYLGSNSYSGNAEFASVLTHEFGHYFNLIHTFEGGCAYPNDNVPDTPPCTSAQGCHTSVTSNKPLNCANALVNSDNYMDYNICYKMFTKGQVDRMRAALQLGSRITLWQDSNLKFTGLKSSVSVPAAVAANPPAIIYPNPSTGRFNIDLQQNGTYTLTIRNTMGGLVYQESNLPGNNTVQIGLDGCSPGIYFLQLSDGGTQQQQYKLHIR